MLTLVLFFILAIGFYSGAKRGLVLQIVYTVGYFIAYLVAKQNYKELASHLELYIPYPSPTEETKLLFFDQKLLLDMDQAFYGAVAFLIILFSGWLIVRFVGIFAHKLTFIPVLKQTNGLAGGILSFLVLYVGIFLVLSTLAMLPVDGIQNQLKNSGLARFIVESTPIFTNQVQHMWIEQMIK